MRRCSPSSSRRSKYCNERCGRTAPTLFISDLHLDGERPDITAQFLEFLEREARQAQALYILGDLFEAWIGDDDPDPDKRRVIDALRSLTHSGVPVYFIHGNRDFLIGRRFAADTGVKLLARWHVDRAVR